MITFACGCGKNLQIVDEHAGKKVKCPACGATSPAPQPALAPVPQAPGPHGTGPPEAGPTISIPEAQSRLSSNDETLGNRPVRADYDGEPSSHDFLRPAKSADELGRLGHFRILKELGRGGMGAVYLAEDVRLLRQVALKVMLPKYASHSKSKERFLREARIAASIENDHIVGIHEVDEDHGIPFLTMPVLKGESLQARLQRDTSLSVAELLRIGWQICQGLQAAHERDLVHRDLKPANLWLEGTRGRVKILDFGLARAVHTDQQLTHSGAVVGTPAYMAPEQARNPKVDGRADLFSLGIVLYRCLVGHAPFTGHDAMSVMLSICTDEPAAPDEQIPGIPLELSNLIMKLLQKDPERRFASAEEVGFALEAIDRKYFMGHAIPGTSLPPTTIQSIPIAQPVTLATVVPATEMTIAAPKPPPTAETNPFAFDDQHVIMPPGPPPETAAPAPILPSPLRGTGAGGEEAAPAASPHFPKKGIFLLIGLGLFALLPILIWQIVIRLTDEKGNVREIPVKPGEKIEIVQNPKKAEPWKPAAAWKPIPMGESPFDKLDAKEIPKKERFDWQPKELVAVLGSHARRHWGFVNAVAISPDGKLAASHAASRTDNLILWDLAKQEVKWALENKGSPHAGSLQFSRDGKRLFCLSYGILRIISLSGEKPIVTEFSPSEKEDRWHEAHFCALCENDRTLVVWGWDDKIALFDLSPDRPKWVSTQVRGKPTTGHNSIFVARESNQIVYGDSSGKLHRATIKNAKLEKDEELPIKLGDKDYASAVAPDGKRLALWGGDRLQLWDLDQNPPKQVQTIKEFVRYESQYAFSPDGRWLTARYTDTALFRIDGPEPKFVAWLDQTGKSGVGEALFSADGNKVVLGNSEGFVRFWDLSDAAPQELSPWNANTTFLDPTPGMAPALDPMRGRLMLSRYDGTSRHQLFDLGQSKPQPVPDATTYFDPARMGPVKQLSLGRWVAVGTQGGENARVFALRDGAWLPDGEAFGDADTFAETSADGKLLVTIGRTIKANDLVGWDLSGPKPHEKWRVPLGNRSGGQNLMSRPVVISADQRLCATAFPTTANGDGPRGELLLWKNLDTKAEIAAVIPLPAESGISHYRNALSPDGRYLAHSKRTEHEIVLEDLSKATSSQVQKLQLEQVLWLAFSPDGKSLAYASHMEVGVLEVPTLKTLWTWKSPGAVNWCEWAADGRHLVTHNGNKTVYVVRLNEFAAAK